METINRLILTFLVNAAWQVPVAAAVAALICYLLRHGPASHRHAVWVSALAVSLLLPIASLRTAGESSSLRNAVPSADRALEAAGVPIADAARTPGAVPALSGRTVSYTPVAGGIFLAVYLAFLLARLAALFRSWVRTERIRNEAGGLVLPPLVEKVWLRCLGAFGLDDVELLVSSSVPSPVAAGTRRKTIILPSSLLEEPSEDVLTTAIGHEMAHLARHDFALKILYEAAWLPLSFHPAALVIRRGIEQTREMAVDELVTRNLLDPGVYAESIMTIANVMTALPRPGYTLGVFDGDILEQRIRRLVERRVSSLGRARVLLVTGLGALAGCAVIASGLAISARAQGGPAQNEIKLAVNAYNHDDLQAAVQHFQSAVALEPANIRPKLFLANALMREYGATKSEGALAAARQQYLDVLARDPQNRQAFEGMAQTALYEKQYAESRNWLSKLLAQNPNDESAQYTIAFIDWVTAYPVYAQTRAAAGMKMETQGMIPDAEARRKFREQYGPQIEEGLQMLHTALQLKPNDDSAMAYMNLLYRMKSGVVDNPDESQQLVRDADQWVEKALEAKRLNAKNPKATHTLDEAADAPGPGATFAPLPPPPPPPPPSAGQPASDAIMAAHNRQEMGGTFWQVTRGSTFANTLAQSLRNAGFSVRIVAGADGLARVMVGPYSDQAALDQAKTALTAAGVTVIREW